MNLEDIVLSKMSRAHTKITVRFHIYEVPGTLKLIDRESRMGVSGDLAGGREWESVFNADRVSVWEDEQILEMMVGMVAQSERA